MWREGLLKKPEQYNYVDEFVLPVYDVFCSI